MTVWNAVYLVSLILAGFASFTFGGERERIVWGGLLAYWALSVAFNYNIVLNLAMSALFGASLVAFSRSTYGFALAGVFFALLGLGGLALVGAISVERGQGFSWTYWNLRTCLLHTACLIVILSANARRVHGQ